MLLLPEITQLEFTKPVYQQEAYWDETKTLGKVDPIQKTHNEDRLPNLTHTGFIDGGDTAFHTGHYYTGLRLLERNNRDVTMFYRYNVIEQELAISQLYVPWTWGTYRRHPDSKNWYGDADRFSRDQQKSIISSEALNPSKGSLKRGLTFIARHFLLRLGLFDAKTRQNGSGSICHERGICNYTFKFPTFTGPTIWASYVRFLMSKHPIWYILYPLLLILDIELPINGIVKNTIDKTDTDVLNHINYSIWFHEVAPTPWTYINNKFINNKKDLTERLLKYYDDGRCPWVNYVIWKELMNIYME